jgi:hypothetical protein
VSETLPKPGQTGRMLIPHENWLYYGTCWTPSPLPFGDKLALILRVDKYGYIEFQAWDDLAIEVPFGHICRVKASVASFVPHNPQIFTWSNFQYRWPTASVPVLEQPLSAEQFGLRPGVIEPLHAGFYVRTVRDLVRLSEEDVRSITGIGDSEFHSLLDLLYPKLLHLAVYDAEIAVPKGERWVPLRPHPVLSSEAGRYLITCLARDPAMYPDDEARLQDIIEQQLAFTIGELLEFPVQDLRGSGWRSGGECVGVPLLSTADSLTWLKGLLHYHGLEMRP